MPGYEERRRRVGGRRLGGGVENGWSFEAPIMERSICVLRKNSIKRIPAGPLGSRLHLTWALDITGRNAPKTANLIY